MTAVVGLSWFSSWCFSAFAWACSGVLWDSVSPFSFVCSDSLACLTMVVSLADSEAFGLFTNTGSISFASLAVTVFTGALDASLGDSVSCFSLSTLPLSLSSDEICEFFD